MCSDFSGEKPPFKSLYEARQGTDEPERAAMTSRERLPNRRQCESLEFRHAGHLFTLCAGFYADGRIAEIFLSSHKPGSPIEAIARDAAITTSLALQHGVTLETIRQALTKDHDGAPATLLGAALDKLAEAP
jgi:hypothetical protein